ncbi:MAG: 16S rRNA (guanine(527)-N(7))-methyltransferase RsmG [Lachnospiraceae bacterium]|nr:16S rRNA (guanine(527)-N(7))-methyltransferase RsmG [Lachnospiraceae bacterium]
MSGYNNDLLKAALNKLSIEYDDKAIEKVDIFYKMLIEKNKVMNLTSITDHDDFITKHIIDSLLPACHISFNDRQAVIDVGTGAGFPGIPLKIFFPDLNITLLDSLNKRLLFLNDVIKELDLNDIKTVHGRAEDIAKNPEYREKYDTGVSRAVAGMSSLSELCIPFIKKDGKFVFYKSKESDNEINESVKAVEILGGKIQDIFNVDLYGTDIVRKIVVVKKTKNTPNKYPRKAGTPLRDPL